MTPDPTPLGPEVLDQILGALVVLRPEGEILSWNHGAEVLFGYATGEARGRSIFDLVIPPERAAETREQIQRALARGAALYESERRRKDGSTVPVAVSLKAVKDPSDGRTLIATNDRDLTHLAPRPPGQTAALEQSLKRLAESEGRYRALTEHANDAILVLDPATRVVEANRAAERLLGRPRAEIVGRSYFDFVAPEDRDDSLRRRGELLAEGTLRVASRELVRPDGTRLTTEVSSSVVRIGGESQVLTILRDVTERRAAEEARRRSEARMKSVLDAALDAVVMMEEHGRVLSWNAQAEALFGWSRDEAIGRVLADLVIPPRYREPHTRGLARFLETGEGPVIGRRIELSAVRRDGSEFPVELTVTALREDGGAYLFNAFIADITDRKRTEEALRKAQQRLQHVVSSSPAVLYTLRVEGGVLVPTWTSANIERFAGYTPEEVAGPGWWADRVHPDDRERVISQVPELLAEGGAVREYRFRHKTGTHRWVRDEQVLVRHGAEPDEVVGSWSDINERKEAELRLQESEEQYRLLFEQNPHPMWVHDTQTLGFLAVNDAAVRHYGYTRDEFLSMTALDIRPPEDIAAFKKQYEERQAKDPTASFISTQPYKHRKKDGTLIDVHIAANPIAFAGREARLVLVTDVTETLTLEKQLVRAQKMEAVGQLAGGVAHDFNNLLGVITGYSELLLRELPSPSREHARAEEIKRASDHAAALTRQLLAFSRRQVLQPKVLDLNVVVAEVEKMLRRLISESIQIVTIAADDLGRVRADEGQVEQVVMNLAINARDAMPSGGRLVIETGNVELDEAYVRTHPEAHPGRYVMLIVSDTGHGMDEKTMSRIFEPFFTTKGEGMGTGLGLATVYGIVRQSGGTVNVYSEPGHGTTFRVYLPRVEAEAATGPRGELVAPAGGTETILLVEDAAALRLLVGELLESAGYRVLPADAPDKALSLVRSMPDPLHLVLTDMVMPRMNGQELARQIVLLKPEARVVFMSGYTDQMAGDEGALAPGTLFLQKPFTMEALLKIIRRALDAG